MKIYYEKCIRYLSATAFSYLFKPFLLCQYSLDVATISSNIFLNSMTRFRYNTAIRVPRNSSAQLNKHSCHLRFIGWFSRELILLQETL
jgi:hypothetical protein